MLYNGDICPKCKKLEMPKWIKGSSVIARKCQNCGLEETLERYNERIRKMNLDSWMKKP